MTCRHPDEPGRHRCGLCGGCWPGCCRCDWQDENERARLLRSRTPNLKPKTKPKTR